MKHSSHIHNAIAEAYTLYQRKLIAVFRQAMIPQDQCEDLVQDVFVKIMSLDTIDQAHLKSLLFVTAIHLRTDYFRHYSLIYKQKITMNLPEINSFEDCSVEYKELREWEDKSISLLSDMDQKVYKLIRFDEKSAKEASTLLNISTRAVESRWFRARNLVKRNLSKVWFDLTCLKPYIS